MNTCQSYLVFDPLYYPVEVFGIYNKFFPVYIYYKVFNVIFVKSCTPFAMDLLCYNVFDYKHVYIISISVATNGDMYRLDVNQDLGWI